jgi:hypothetical protein
VSRPARGALVARVAAAALFLLAAAGCRCTTFPSGVAPFRCDGPGASCPSGRVCAETAGGAWFCVVTAGDAGGGTDAGGTDAGAAIDASPSDAACGCDDDDPCNGVETCAAGGGCNAGTPVDCGALDDACHLGVCNAVTGGCQQFPRADGTPCDDGLFCSDPDACEAGDCRGPARAACSATGNVCADGGCDEATDSCTGAALPDGTACDDGLFCTVNDTCFALACSGSTRPCTLVGDPQCNVPGCDELGASCFDVPANESGPCTTGGTCTGETCSAGVCGGGMGC